MSLNVQLTHCGLVMPEIQVTIGSGNGSLLDGTKPLPQPMFFIHPLENKKKSHSSHVYECTINPLWPSNATDPGQHWLK